MNERFRLLLLFLVFASAIAVEILLVIYGLRVFPSLGISDSASEVILSFFCSLPIAFFLFALYERFVLEVPFPSVSQAFLHPKNAIRIMKTKGKLLLILYAIIVLLFALNYFRNTVALGVSIGITIMALYSLVVGSEVAYRMSRSKSRPSIQKK